MKPEIQAALQKVFLLNCYSSVYRKDIPPTRDELEKVGVLKKQLKVLESNKLCTAKLLILKEGRGSCGRVSYSLTDLGKEVCSQLGFKAPDIQPAPEESVQTEVV